MVRRTRSAKVLGTRHDLNYFKNWSLFRRWRLALTVAVSLAAIAWLGATGIRKKEVVYSSGPLSSAHSFFTGQCSLCHTTLVNGVKQAGFRKHPTDEACLTCHEAPRHQANEAFTPECSSCHIEHKGAMRLAHVQDSECTQCHSDLFVKGGHARFVANITGFNKKHPEFAALRAASGDPGTIALNHAAHLGDAILGPGGRVKLECSDCHRSMQDANVAWKYSNPHLEVVAATNLPGDVFQPRAGRELMAPIKFEKQCVACHSLQFDKRFAEPVPHTTTDVVHAFVLSKFREYIAQHPQAVRELPPTSRQIPGARPGPRPARNSEEWIAWRVQEAEQLLWRKTCKQCHQLDFPPEGSVPKVRAAAMTVRWLPNSVFSHESHRALDCAACHLKAAGSQKTSEVLIPGIESCQSCHNGDPKKVGRAENGCFLCHQYHNWNERKGMRGRYTIPQLTGAVMPVEKTTQ